MLSLLRHEAPLPLFAVSIKLILSETFAQRMDAWTKTNVRLYFD